MRWFGVCTLFPQSFSSLTREGVISRAIKQKLIGVSRFNIRNHALNARKKVDDRPFGGGPGMVLQAQPLLDCIEKAKKKAEKFDTPVKVILLSPQGKQFNHQAAKAMAESNENYIFVCGRYEGIDERLIELAIDQEWSIGDFVLTGGELGAMVMIDAIARLIPGVLGEQKSFEQDSFANGLLDCPHYTRPPVFAGQKVPPVLLSGSHHNIEAWRYEQSLERTLLRRPELLKDLALTEKQKSLLAMLKEKHKLDID